MSTKTVNLTMQFDGQETQSASAGVLPSYTRNYTVRRTLSRTRTGVFNPNWKKIIAAGGNASTTLTASESTIEWKSPNGTLQYLAYNSLDNSDGKASLIDASASGLVNYYPPPAILNHNGNTSSEWEANVQAVTYLYRAVRRAHAQAEGGVILGELHKTLGMIARPAMALRNGLDQYVNSLRKTLRGQIKTRRNGRKYPTPNAKKILADTYLEYTYGWSPLINDVKDAAVALARMNHPEYEKSRFRVFGEHESANSQYSIPFSTPAQICFNKNTVVSGKQIVIYYGALQATTKVTGFDTQPQRIIDLSGFSLTNFVPTIWELVPYSFLIDYFTNIGDLLMAATTDTSRVAWLTKVVIKETTDKTALVFDPTATANPAHFSPRWYKYLSCGGGSGGYFTRYRTVNRGPCEMPFLTPTLQVPNMKQFVNIGALLLGSTSGRRWSLNLI